MKNTLLAIGLIFLLANNLYAAQSVIIDSEGYACMGDDKSRKDTEQTAMQDARRKAGDAALTYIQAETHIKDSMLEKDLVSAYTNAQVKLIQELLKEWFKDSSSGDCYRVKLKLEVTPDEKAMAVLAKKKVDELFDDPAAPLSVKVWTDKKQYKDGEKIRVFIKGNRPFYGRVVYKDATGSLVQLLPNPYRQENYFNGSTVYELPSGDDRFDLDVCSPFGVEMVTLFASTAPLGDLDVTPYGGIYEVRTKAKEVPIGTRGVKIVAKGTGGAAPAVAEFAEATGELRTCAK
jgi:hypothetical protein